MTNRRALRKRTSIQETEIWVNDELWEDMARLTKVRGRKMLEVPISGASYEQINDNVFVIVPKKGERVEFLSFLGYMDADVMNGDAVDAYVVPRYDEGGYGILATLQEEGELIVQWENNDGYKGVTIYGKEGEKRINSITSLEELADLRTLLSLKTREVVSDGSEDFIIEL